MVVHGSRSKKCFRAVESSRGLAIIIPAVLDYLGDRVPVAVVGRPRPKVLQCVRVGCT